MTIASMQLSLAQPINTVSATKKHKLGMLYVDEYGRKWRYCKNGASALAAGKCVAATEATANHINKSVAAAAIGAVDVAITIGATALTANSYDDGYFQVNDGTGEGQSYPIVSHTVSAAGSEAVYVKLAEPLRAAIVASATSEASLIPSPYYAVTISSSINALCVGVSTVVVPASYYFWAQTGGVTAVLQNTGATAAVGTQMILGTDDGSVDVVATSSDIDDPKIGYHFGTVGVATEYKPIYLEID